MLLCLKTKKLDEQSTSINYCPYSLQNFKLAFNEIK